MQQEKGYKFRLYPAEEQKHMIASILGCCRFAYNSSLQFCKDTYAAEKRSVSQYENMRRITELKSSPETEWLKECDSMALQEVVKDLNKAFRSFFKKRAGYPKFHSKRESVQSYRTRNQGNGIRFESDRIHIPRIGLVKVRRSRDLGGRILNATVSRTSTGKYYVSLCVEEEVIPKPNAGGRVGIDAGITEFYTDSNGYTVKNPKTLARYQKQLIREQKRLSRKQPGSKNQDRQRVRVARIHEKITNRRKDFLHKESTRLVNENQVIGIEDLNVRGMLHNRHLAKAISDVSWGEFIRQLEYKAYEHGSHIVRVPRFFASSQICSICGGKNPLVKNLAVREWTCPNCGTAHKRDHNAAVNILNQALASL